MNFSQEHSHSSDQNYDLNNLMVNFASFRSTKSSKGKQNDWIFRNQLRNLLFYLVGLPRTGDLKCSTTKCIDQFEKTSSVFHVIRFGIKQKKGEYRFTNATQFKVRSFLIRIFSLISFIRLLMLIVIPDESVHIYLGNAIYGLKHSTALYFTSLITLVSLFGLGEISLLQESLGHYEPIRTLDQIRNPNLDPSSVGLSRKYLAQVRGSIHFVAIQFRRIMNSAPFYIIAIFGTPLLSSLSFKENPMFTFYCLLWSFCLAYPFIYHMAGNFGRTGYIIMFCICNIFRLRSLETLVRHSSRQLLIIERDINSLILIIIRFCNEMEDIIRKFRFNLLYVIFVIAFMGDVHLFFGVIVTLKPSLVSHLLAINGTVVLFSLGLTVYYGGVYLNTLQSTVVQFHRICINKNISVLTKLKINELMDRMAGPYNGIKAGGFATLTTKFFVIFLAENAATIMLFAVNAVQHLIK